MLSESEFIEREALLSLHEAASPKTVSELQLQCISMGSALVSVAGALPASAIVINRAPGMGLTSPESEDSVNNIVQTYRKAGVKRFFMHRHLSAQPTGLADWFIASGLKKSRGWQKFIRGSEPVPQIKTDFTIKEIGPEYTQQFASITCDAFDLGAGAIPWLAQLPGRNSWHCFYELRGRSTRGCRRCIYKR